MSGQQHLGCADQIVPIEAFAIRCVLLWVFRGTRRKLKRCCYVMNDLDPIERLEQRWVIQKVAVGSLDIEADQILFGRASFNKGANATAALQQASDDRRADKSVGAGDERGRTAVA